MGEALPKSFFGCRARDKLGYTRQQTSSVPKFRSHERIRRGLAWVPGGPAELRDSGGSVAPKVRANLEHQPPASRSGHWTTHGCLPSPQQKTIS